MGLDNYFIMKRLMEVPVEQTLIGASGRVLEVAAAEAVHSCRLAEHGLEWHVVEPSEQMLARAREHMASAASTSISCAASPRRCRIPTSTSTAC